MASKNTDWVIRDSNGETQLIGPNKEDLIYLCESTALYGEYTWEQLQERGFTIEEYDG